MATKVGEVGEAGEHGVERMKGAFSTKHVRRIWTFDPRRLFRQIAGFAWVLGCFRVRLVARTIASSCY